MNSPHVISAKFYVQICLSRPLTLSYFRMSTTKEHRKSVAFSEGTTVLNSDGEVTKVNGTSDKASADSHTTGGCAVMINNILKR